MGSPTWPTVLDAARVAGLTVTTKDGSDCTTARVFHEQKLLASFFAYGERCSSRCCRAVADFVVAEEEYRIAKLAEDAAIERAAAEHGMTPAELGELVALAEELSRC